MEEIQRLLKKVSGWIKYGRMRVNASIVVLLLLLIGLSLQVHYCDRNKTEELYGKIELLEHENDILMNKIIENNNVINTLDSTIILLYDSMKIKDRILDALKVDYKRIQANRDSLLARLRNIPPDSSYIFLAEDAYPYEGDGRYPFNEPQVKGIHLTYIDHHQLEKLNYNLLGQVGEMEDKIAIKDRVINLMGQKVVVYESNLQKKDTIINNQSDQIDLQDKEIKKENRTGTFFKITTTIATVLAMALFFFS